MGERFLRHFERGVHDERNDNPSDAATGSGFPLGVGAFCDCAANDRTRGHDQARWGGSPPLHQSKPTPESDSERVLRSDRYVSTACPRRRAPPATSRKERLKSLRSGLRPGIRRPQEALRVACVHRRQFLIRYSGGFKVRDVASTQYNCVFQGAIQPVHEGRGRIWANGSIFRMRRALPVRRLLVQRHGFDGEVAYAGERALDPPGTHARIRRGAGGSAPPTYGGARERRRVLVAASA